MSMFFYYVDEVKSVVGYRPAIQGFLSSAEGLLLLYYGICMIYRNRGLVSGSHHNRFNALRRMTTLCFMAFVGYVLQAVSCILLTDDREESANGYVVRYLCYRASTLILYGSLLWTLRVDGSLSDMRNHGRSTTRGLATDSGDGYNDDEVLNDHADLHKRQHRTLARHFSIELPPPSTPARHTARNSFDLSSQRDTLRSTMNSRPDSPVVQPPPPPSLIFPSRTLAAAPVLHLPTIPTPDLAAYERWIARFRGPMESNPPSSSATFSSSFNTSPLHAPDPSSSLSPSSLTQALIAKNATATAEPDRATLAACTTASSRHDVTANTWPNSPRHGPVLLPVGHGLVIGPLDLANDVSEEPRRHRLST
ncbi:hypothetical protein IWQ60_012051 [Tieghemiomyces parasiticus]|uniref:Uncharacterized protein n=1 Tax=Tieghemiomyces parasiticus TaxID=78921 RepID=A0A9W7ZG04_9FUNG|nr:hypothetical protein IWQ60_012051 [Tieghemiomyces parasiticus]